MTTVTYLYFKFPIKKLFTEMILVLSSGAPSQNLPTDSGPWKEITLE